MYKGVYKIQFGKESQLGTEVNATTISRFEGYINEETELIYPPEAVGVAGGVGRIYVPKKTAVLGIDETPVTFEQLPYFLNSMFTGVAGSQDGGGSDYIFSYTLPYSSAPVPYSYTFEAGDEQQAEILTGCFTETLTISGESAAALMMTPTMRGQPKGTTTFTAGQSVPSIEEASFGNTKLYIDDVGDGFGTTQITDSFQYFELQINNVIEAKWDGDGDGVYHNRLKWNSLYEITLTFAIEHNATAVAEIANRRAGTPRAIHIICEGADVGTPGTTYSAKTLIMNIAGTYMSPGTFEDQDSDILREFTLKNHYNSTLTSRGTIIVVNELSALP